MNDLLRDDLTYRAETWRDGRGHMRECPHEAIFFNFWNPRWPPNGLYIKKEFFVFFGLNDSEMARPIMLKFGGMVEGICKNNLAE